MTDVLPDIPAQDPNKCDKCLRRVYGRVTAWQVMTAREDFEKEWLHMVITEGEKVHIITRRCFEGALRHHFAGVVEAVEGGMIRVIGHLFVYDQVKAEFVRKKQRRTRIFGMGDAGLIITVLPETVEVDDLHYIMDTSGIRTLTDNHTFAINVTEFGVFR